MPQTTNERIKLLTQKFGIKDDESEDMFKAPIEKSKRDTKRKANEAIVGDTRFKVDSAAGIIIY